MRKVNIVKKEVNREEVQAWVQERFELSVTRISGIAKEHAAASPFGDYFNSQAAFILYVENIYKMRQDGGFARLTTEALAEMNHC
ncbi:leucyl aminopeptidase, partial [Coprococcus sp. CLA-AA-H190]